MSKSLVYKALSLLEDDVEQDKPQKKNVNSSVKQKKRNKRLHKLKNPSFQSNSKGILKNSTSVDRTEENLKILMQLKALKPKASVAQKVIELYTKPTNPVGETEEKDKKQKSILFDDDGDDDDNNKDKKKRKKKKCDVDAW